MLKRFNGELRYTVQRARPKRLVQYYRGYIFSDRAQNAAVDALANEAWALYKEGLIHLLQRRMGEYDYIYYFVVR